MRETLNPILRLKICKGNLTPNPTEGLEAAPHCCQGFDSPRGLFLAILVSLGYLGGFRV